MDVVESDLSPRIAATLASFWNRAPLNDRPGVELAPDVAARHARTCLGLFCEALRDMPEEGWTDLRVSTTAMILAGFGDGYAFASLTDRPRSGSLPDLAPTANMVVLLEIDRWCRDHGHALPALPAPRSRTSELDMAERNEQQVLNLAEIGLAVDLASRREAERPDWEGFSEASIDAAARLDSWMEGYRATLGFINDLPVTDVPDYLVAFRQQSRPLILNELFHTRHKLHVRFTNGAQTEAALATMFMLPVLRSLYLLSTAEDRDDALQFPIVPPDRMNAILERTGVTPWLEAERRTRRDEQNARQASP
jgi:hypothetical protein